MKAKTLLVMAAIVLSPTLHAEIPPHADELNKYANELSDRAKKQLGNQFSSEQYKALEEEGGRVSQSMVDAINERFGKYIAPAIKERQEAKPSSSNEGEIQKGHFVI